LGAVVQGAGAVEQRLVELILLPSQGGFAPQAGFFQEAGGGGGSSNAPTPGSGGAGKPVMVSRPS
jgi:hypothetical protein